MDAITVQDLRKVYGVGSPHPVPAVDGVSFDVPLGQIFGLLGPNGAGKTTLVKILTTITAPTSTCPARRWTCGGRSPSSCNRRRWITY